MYFTSLYVNNPDKCYLYIGGQYIDSLRIDLGVLEFNFEKSLKCGSRFINK